MSKRDKTTDTNAQNQNQNKTDNKKNSPQSQDMKEFPETEQKTNG